MAVTGEDDDVVDAVADAWVWGYPLLSVHRTRGLSRPPGPTGPVGADRLATADDRAVVAPNNDTLYGSGFYDLRGGDLRVEVDPMRPADRYWSVMLVDAHTHVAYVCRRLHGREGTSVRVTLDPRRPAADAPGQDPVPVATPTVWVLVRVGVDGPADLEAARRDLAGVRITQEGSGPEHDLPAVASVEDPVPALRALAALRTLDPPAPWQPAPTPAAEDVLAHLPPDDVVVRGVDRGRERLRAAGAGADAGGNGWGTRRRGARFGDDVTYRAAFARVSLAGHLPAENRAYLHPVDGRRPVRLTFPAGGLPPVGAFWSLTLYGADGFFVVNPIDRWSISDRTPGVEPAADGSLSIDVGHDPPADPAGWLPAPEGGAVVALRCYEGAPEVVDATWAPPPLRPLDDG
ncbi:DUF1214 domain-containing protein [Iamia majanohamensis]|uniref:DUF1214 domain-containing protein n=1 Tax=Iamia majanohamensis TaxID=467976 RepID=A0AAF0BRN2_9ACTN|nr:DUF1214 domain-containing protein [Iamia majanohamensis]WCO66996.1 DUF1214 domain-containing protein [Iamia majanohamensis]